MLGRREQRLGQAAAGKRNAVIRIFPEPADAGAIPGPRDRAALQSVPVL